MKQDKVMTIKRGTQSVPEHFLFKKYMHKPNGIIITKINTPPATAARMTRGSIASATGETDGSICWDK